MNKKIIAAFFGLIFLSTLQTSFAISGSGYSIECDGDDKVFVNPYGQIIRRFHCRHGCSNGACNDSPPSRYRSSYSTYRYECQGKYSLKIQSGCNNVVSRKYCDYGCNRDTGECNKKPQYTYEWGCGKKRWAEKEYKVKYRIYLGAHGLQVREKVPGTKQYCDYGCLNGKCRKRPQPTPTPAPSYKWRCEKHRGKYYSEKYDTKTGNIAISKSCEYGCNYWTGKCKKQPKFKWKCKWSFSKGSYSIQYYKVGWDLHIVKEENCNYGCSWVTGKCNPEPKPKYEWQCRGKYRVKVDITCGNIVGRQYCPYGCLNGECEDDPPKPTYSYKKTTCTTTYCRYTYRRETYKSYGNPGNNNEQNPGRSGVSFASYEPVTTSNYGKIYGNPNAQKQCTYNADCGYGKKCIYNPATSRKECVPEYSTYYRYS